MEETKKCPYCGEEIMAVAKKCRYCGEWLDDKPSPTIKGEKINKTLLSSTIGCIVLVIAVVVIILTTSGHDNKGSDMYSDIISQDSIAYVSQIDSIKESVARDSLALWNADSNVNLDDLRYREQIIKHSKYIISQIPVIRQLTGINHGLTDPTQEQKDIYSSLSKMISAVAESRAKFVLSLITGEQMEENAFNYRYILEQWENYKTHIDPSGKNHKVMTKKDVNKAIYDDLNTSFGSIVMYSDDKLYNLVNIQNKILNY